MLKIVKVSSIVVLGFGLSLVQTDPLQKYDVKSGKIDYNIQANGNIMGMSQINTVGKKRIIFSDYVSKNLKRK